jgi:hypothetical protein
MERPPLGGPSNLSALFVQALVHRSKKIAPDIRFGSKADIAASSINVCFTPESGHRNSVVECPLRAKSGHSRSLPQSARLILAEQLGRDRPIGGVVKPLSFYRPFRIGPLEFRLSRPPIVA